MYILRKIKKSVCHARKYALFFIFHHTEITSWLKSSSLFTPSIPREVLFLVGRTSFLHFRTAY